MDKSYNDIEAIIIKSLQGETSAGEEQLLLDWLSEADAHPRQYEEVKSLWEAAGDVDFGLDPRTEGDWDKLALKLAVAGEGKAGRVVRFQSWRFAAAAVVLAGLLGLVAYYFTGSGGPAVAQEFTVPEGDRREVQLPDGTLVALNAASRLQLLKGFNEKERRLRLKGEGYFQVAPDAGRPFIIETEAAQVQVTGTAFNLRAYPESTVARLTVTEGSVRFSGLSGKEGQPVTAGEAAELDKASGSIRTIPFDERAAAWQQGVLVFDDTPWPEVVRSLERYYAIEVEDNTGLQGRTYSSSFDNQPLEATLKVMQMTLGFEAEYNDGRLILK